MHQGLVNIHSGVHDCSIGIHARQVGPFVRLAFKGRLIGTGWLISIETLAAIFTIY
ncbi:MAG: hypothetical protein ACKO0V_19275 [bacterium]